jgi:hypothetical protein
MRKRIGLTIVFVVFLLMAVGGSALLLVPRVAHASPGRDVKVNCGGQLPPACYTSISAAVSAANAGDVIHVFPGVFLEKATLNITVPLTLQGAGAGLSTLQGDLNEEMINVSLAVPGNLTIKGLTIEGNDLPHPNCGGYYIQLSSALSSDSIEIADNHFMETDKTDPSHGICFTAAYHNFQDPSPARLTLRNNLFVGFTEVAEFFDHTGPLLVAGNDSEQLDGFGVFHTALDDNTCCSALTISAIHEFSHNTFAGYAGQGILIESNNATFTNVRLLSNTFNITNTSGQPAMSVGGYGAGGQVRMTAMGNVFQLTGDIVALQVNQAVTGVIKGNLLAGDITPGSVGLNVTTGSLYPESLTITGNRITGFNMGLWAEPAAPPGGAAAQTIAAQQNCIQGNVGYGAENTSPITLQASNNWWGAASGPFDPIGNPGGMGNAVFGAITYKPFLTAAPACP